MTHLTRHTANGPPGRDLDRLAWAVQSLAGGGAIDLPVPSRSAAVRGTSAPGSGRSPSDSLRFQMPLAIFKTIVTARLRLDQWVRGGEASASSHRAEAENK